MTANKDTTTIVEGKGDAEAIKARISQIKLQIEDTTSDFDREKLQERLAKLSGGVAVLKVGAATEVELKEKKHRIEDALSAARAGVEEGMVAGGGSVLVHSITGARQGRGPQRRGHRRQHPAPRARGAAAPDRDQRRPGGLGRRRGGPQAPAGHGYDAQKGEYVDMFAGRHHRPGQGDPLGARERRDRSPACSSRRRRSSPISRRRRRRRWACRPAAGWTSRGSDRVRRCSPPSDLSTNRLRLAGSHRWESAFFAAMPATEVMPSARMLAGQGNFWEPGLDQRVRDSLHVSGEFSSVGCQVGAVGWRSIDAFASWASVPHMTASVEFEVVRANAVERPSSSPGPSRWMERR